jgi:serine/threonine-protein kinase
MIGTWIAHYRIEAELGAGGMGVVYRAHDEKLGRDVALKLLLNDIVGDERARARLLEEARKAAALNHPSICTIHEAGMAGGRTYIAMEWVQGQPLSKRIPTHGLPVETAVAWAAQIAEGLAHAHERGIVHRDLKPGNVVITSEARAKILDFGIARRVDPDGAALTATTMSATGAMAGTPYYLPPEVLRGVSADARGDIWALGVLLHEMLSGERPFAGATEFELGAAILNADPKPLPARVPPALAAIVHRCLAKDPAARYRSAGEVRAALEVVRSASPDAHAAPAAVPSRRALPLVQIIAAIVIVLALVALLPRFASYGPVAHGPIRSLAVLPLENLSGDPQQEYFADGMTEELIASLSNLENVRVISRTSVMRYRHTTKSVPQIGRELAVDAVIEGSAMRAGDRVRITAQLIRAAEDQHLWAKSYERDMRDVLALQGEVSQAIAAEIRVALSPHGLERARAAPVDPAAYEEYLKGRYEWSKRTAESLGLAMKHFERAIGLDSTYAMAYSGLADVYAVMPPHVRGVRAADVMPRARMMAERALRLDPGLARAHATLGLIMGQFEYEWAAGLAALDTALALEPNYATAHQWKGRLLAEQGRLDEALAEVGRAQTLDPLAPVVVLNRGQVLQWQRRYDEAIAVLERLTRDAPGFDSAHVWLGRAYLWKGDYRAFLIHAYAADSLSGIHDFDDPEVRAALLAGDAHRYWRRFLTRIEQRARMQYVPPSVFVVVHSQLGDRERALDYLRKAFDESDGTLFTELRDTSLDPLRSDPRFVALMREHGLAP